MIIKKFQGTSETEAIMLAKEELGKDAIVMNIKTISPKGIYKIFRKPLVEITAAIDNSQPVVQEKKEIVQDKKIPKLNPNIIYEDEKPDVPVPYKSNLFNETKETNSIEVKLNNLQSLLEKQLNESLKDETVKPMEEDKNIQLIQLVYNQLIRNDVDEKYVNQLLSEIESKLKKDTTLDVLLSHVYQKLILKLGQPQTIHLEDGKLKFVFFIGPTGVGKTTTIAKIASSLKLEKHAKVAMLTSDTYRIAAVDQLRTYANILNIPMKVIYSEAEIEDAKDEFKEYDVVLVDTAGRSHRSQDQIDELDRIVKSVDDSMREIYLVLSSTTKYKDLVQIVETYETISKYRLIFTKLDETITIGNIFNIKMLTKADLSYTTYGQNVPDDISKIDTQETAKKLLGGND